MGFIIDSLRVYGFIHLQLADSICTMLSNINCNKTCSTGRVENYIEIRMNYMVIAKHIAKRKEPIYIQCMIIRDYENACPILMYNIC